VPDRHKRWIVILALVALGAGVACGQKDGKEGRSMSELSPQQKVLGQQILAEQIPAARVSAEHLGAAAGPVLEILAKHEKSKVRLLVLELAPLAVSVESSRSVITLLSDSNPTVHAVALGDLAVCSQKEVVPDLLKVLDPRPDADVTKAVIRQIGIAGDSNQIRDLRPYLSNSDPEIAHQASIAMARLGDQAERDKIVKSLNSSDAQVRVGALRDCQYVADKGLVKYFGPVLDDFRDFMVVTPPHIEPIVVVRVCDIAVQTMAYMGFQFSYSAQFLARRSMAELAEAKMMVAALIQAQ
jgi:hypothetical protein